MTISHILWYYLWVAPKVLLVVLLCGMVRRGLHRQFPMFFFYAVLQVVQSGFLFVISRSHFGYGDEYHHTLSVTIALSAAVRFGVIHELFTHFFREYPVLVGSGRALLRGATIALLFVALGLAVLAPGNGANFLVNATYALDRTVCVLQFGLLISLFLFSRYFVISWRSHAFGIALGLGVYASVELATSTIWLHLGAFGNPVVNLFTMATYHCCVLIWIFYLMAPARSLRPTSTTKTTKRKMTKTSMLPECDLEIWNRELERLLQR
jgi:hypothetical protein